MTVADGRRAFPAWPAAVADALDTALAAAAETVAAEARRELGTNGAGTVATGRDEAGRATLRVTSPAAVAREYGTRQETARPFLRPAIAAAHQPTRQALADAVRRALSRRNAR